MAVGTYYKFLMRRPFETYGRSYDSLELASILWIPGTVIALPSGVTIDLYSKTGVSGGGILGFDTLARAACYACPGVMVRFTADDADKAYGGTGDIAGYEGLYRFFRVTVLDYVSASTVQALYPLVTLSAINDPVNPLLLTATTGLDLLGLLKKWATVRTLAGSPQAIAAKLPDKSYYFSMFQSVYNWALGRPHASNVDTTARSLLDTVTPGPIKNNSIADAAAAYAAGLFPGVTDWGFDPAALPAGVTASDPFRPLLTLWNAGYLPVYDAGLWTLRAGANATVALTADPRTW